MYMLFCATFERAEFIQYVKCSLAKILNDHRVSDLKPTEEMALIPRNQHKFTVTDHHVAFLDKCSRLVEEERATDLEAFDRNLSRVSLCTE